MTSDINCGKVVCPDTMDKKEGNAADVTSIIPNMKDGDQNSSMLSVKWINGKTELSVIIEEKIGDASELSDVWAVVRRDIIFGEQP